MKNVVLGHVVLAQYLAEFDTDIDTMGGMLFVLFKL